jgi:hypothetical protein
MSNNIISWNVNEIRAINKSGKLEKLLTDVEIRCSTEHIKKELKDKYPNKK